MALYEGCPSRYDRPHMTLLALLKNITGHPLNRGRRLWSVLRFACWQFGIRLIPGEAVFTWVNGARFHVKRGENGLTGNIYKGLDEFEDMAFVLHLLREGDLFVDVGANVGSYTVLACASVGARGVAFEPVPTAYERLVGNVRLNHAEDRVRCLSLAVGAETGSLEFTSGQDSMNHALAPGEHDERAILVKETTLDEALVGESPTLIKVDVEGFETRVLEGAPATLANPSLVAVIIELNGSGERYGSDESRIVETMRGHGFGTYAYRPTGRELVALEGKNPESWNTLFVRDEAFVGERVRSAPEVVVHGKRI